MSWTLENFQIFDKLTKGKNSRRFVRALKVGYYYYYYFKTRCAC